jgi:hypothetical protein
MLGSQCSSGKHDLCSGMISRSLRAWNEVPCGSGCHAPALSFPEGPSPAPASPARPLPSGEAFRSEARWLIRGGVPMRPLHKGRSSSTPMAMCSSEPAARLGEGGAVRPCANRRHCRRARTRSRLSRSCSPSLNRQSPTHGGPDKVMKLSQPDQTKTVTSAMAAVATVGKPRAAT